jgi:hypothetical protein
MEPSRWINRRGEPSKHDQLPYGTICKSGDISKNNFNVYVQTSRDECFPCWEKIFVSFPESDYSIEKEVDKLLNIKQVR